MNGGCGDFAFEGFEEGVEVEEGGVEKGDGGRRVGWARGVSDLEGGVLGEEGCGQETTGVVSDDQHVDRWRSMGHNQTSTENLDVRINNTIFRS
jgi:hypothetical protein